MSLTCLFYCIFFYQLIKSIQIDLLSAFRRYCPLGKDLQSNIKRFPELRKTLDALREKKDDNKDYNKTPEYLVRHQNSELFLSVDKSESLPRNILCLKLIREIFKCHCQFAIKVQLL